MIGRYLSKLTWIEEDRVLTRKMEPFHLAHEDSACLIGAVHGITERHLKCEFVPPALAAAEADVEQWLGMRYNWLCERFGTERVNAAIRNRILSNQARRTLKDVPETARV